MKQIIKLMGVLLGKILFESTNLKKFSEEKVKILILKQYESIIFEYSNSVEKDFLRIAVIKSLKFSLPLIFDLLKSDNYILLLAYSKTFVRLLQDELPDIRQKMASCLSKILGKYISKSTEDYSFNFNVVLEKYSEFLIDLFKKNLKINEKIENLKELFIYLISMVFESEFFKFKKTNYIDKRIFSFDKPNKFHDDVSLKHSAFSHLKSLEYFLRNRENVQSLKAEIRNIFENFIVEGKFSFMVINNFKERQN